MALDVAKVDVEHREIVLRDKPDAMLAESPKGTVPVLVFESGDVLEESLDIMRWALAQHDPEGWLDGSGAQPWLDANDAFKPDLDRYKYFNRYPEEGREATEARCRAHLQSMDDVLASSPYLLGENVSIADAALFPFVRQFHFCDVKRLEHWKMAHLRTWLESFLTSGRFERVMAKRPVWQSASVNAN